MRPSSRVLAPLLLLTLATATSAQSFTYPLNPQATFYRTNQDSPAPPLLLDLNQLGIGAGQWLRIGSVGSFVFQLGGQDSYRSLNGIFSSSSTLLADTVQQRVPDAIPAGPTFAGGETYYGNLPMAMPQNFTATRMNWDDHVVVQVPVGATHLFLGTYDSFYGDNSDPNGDFAAVVSVVPSPTLPGTSEHISLLSSSNGAPVSEVDVKTAAPGSAIVAELHHPVGGLAGSLYLYLADIMPTGGSAPQLLPNLWVSSILIVQFGVVPPTPQWHDTWSLVTPTGYAGTTLIVQVGALSPIARNGFYEATDAHRFQLQ